MLRAVGAMTLLLASAPARAAIVLDGRLDEPEWQQAQRMSDFKTTEPLSLAEPELYTEVLVHSDENGIYFGFICDQPASVPRDRNKGARDEFVPGDRVNLMLDLDGSGTTGYEFTAYLGGEKQDSIISRQLNYSYDWDGDWDYAANENEQQWFIEYHLPWSVAPMGAVKDGRTTIGAFFSRFVTHSNRRYSLPAHAFDRATFVTDMHKLSLRAYERRLLDLFPYVAATHDALSEDNDTRAGLDLFWKPNGQHQLTATLNPDFGQVESDQMVVNFTAIETLFVEKRPFFTENQGLFSSDLTLVNTRRIGARPDAGPEGASDILGALKYTGRSGALDYGLFTAFEDDSSVAEGRDYYVGRARYQFGEHFKLGWIGTHVERPTRSRRADVNGLDFAWTLAPGVSLSGLASVSDITRPETATTPRSARNPLGTGYGGTMVFNYAPGGRLVQRISLQSLSDNWQINDAGFATRNSMHLVGTRTTYTWRELPADSGWREVYVFAAPTLRRNDRGEQLGNFLYFNVSGIRKDTRYFEFFYNILGFGGVDDLVTRGNGNVKDPAQHSYGLAYNSPTSGLLRYYTYFALGPGNFGGSHREFYIEPGLYFGERFSVRGSFNYIQSPDELIWQGSGALLGSFDYEQLVWSTDLDWFPAARHELRLKFQWSHASGAARRGLVPDARGNLMETTDPISDFSQSETALQLRYRYELAPQSELFAVYSHGGLDERTEPERSLGSALRRGLAEETASQFLLKLRYRFGLAQ